MNTEFKLKSQSSFRVIKPLNTTNCLTIKEELIVKVNENMFVKPMDCGYVHQIYGVKNFINKPQDYNEIKEIIHDNRLDYDFFLILFANGVQIICKDYNEFLGIVNLKE